MYPNRLFSSERGFTLIEAMLAMVIVSIGVLSLQAFYSSILQSEVTSEARLTAVHMAEQIIEEWQQSNTTNPPSVQCAAGPTALPLDTPTTCVGTGSNTTSFSITASISPARAPMPPATAGGTVNWAVMSPYTNPNTGVTIAPYTRAVTVSWQYKGETRQVMLTHLTRLPQ